MKITEEMMEQLLPQNILDSELSLASKKVLAAMLDWYKNSQAAQTQIVIISNKVLCSIAGVGGTSLQESLRELDSYNLVTRTIGTKLGDASKYRIHFRNLIKPLRKMTFEEMFSKELESQENPISTIVKNSIVKNSIEYNIKENINKNNNIINNNILEKNNILKENILKENKKLDSTKVEDNENKNNFKNTSTIMKINKEKTESTQEVKRPSTYKELIEYFKEKMIQLTPNRTLDELNEIQESLKDELDEFSEINDFKNVYRYFILPSMEKKKDKLITKELGNSFNVEVVELEGAEKVF